MRMKLFFSLALIVLCPGALALDQNDENALKDTQDMLASPDRLNAIGKSDSEADKALEKIKTMTNNDPAKTAEIHSISSSIFTDMVKSSKGDSLELQQQLQKALKDPQSFMKGLSPAQQQRIRSLASEIDQQNQNTKK